MDQIKELDANISKEETKIIITVDSVENPLLVIRISLQDQTSPMGTTIRTKVDHMIKAKSISQH